MSFFFFSYPSILIAMYFTDIIHPTPPVPGGKLSRGIQLPLLNDSSYFYQLDHSNNTSLLLCSVQVLVYLLSLAASLLPPPFLFALKLLRFLPIPSRCPDPA